MFIINCGEARFDVILWREHPYIGYARQCVIVYYHAFMEMYTPFARALGNSNLILCPLYCFVDGINHKGNRIPISG